MSRQVQPPLVFEDRREAGRLLGARLARRKVDRDTVVLGLPRGGVIVAAEVARALRVPLGVAPVARFGFPEYEEITLGAVAPGRIRIVNEDLARPLHVPEWVIAAGAGAARRRLAARMRTLSGGDAMPALERRTVVLVDDGLHSGASVRAAAAWCKARGARRIIAAMPVARLRALRALAALPQPVEVVCLSAPRRFGYVGWWYLNFDLVTIAEARAALDGDPRPAPDEPPGRRVIIPAGRARLVGNLERPPQPRGLVIFAHGSGSSRRSTRNVATARALNREGFATLLLDLLTEREAAADHRSGRHRFDIPLLTRRMVAAIDWITDRRETARTRIALLGVSTGAAAALVAASRRSEAIATVVSRGGRPDLAGAALRTVRCPVLLLVGGRDRPTLAINRRAAKRMRCPCRLRIVPGATHVFEEPGTLRQATSWALDWLRDVFEVRRSPLKPRTR